MSLVNDALKRARQTEPKTLAPAEGPSLTPVEHPRRAGNPDFLMASLVAVILLLAGLLLWQWLRGDGGVIQVRAKYVPAAQTPSATVAPAPIAPAIPPAPAVTVAPPVSAPLTKPAAPAPPVVPAPATYKLQSIFFFAQNPTAMINGKTVSVGSRIGDARVLSISRDSATIVTPPGHTVVLDLQ